MLLLLLVILLLIVAFNLLAVACCGALGAILLQYQGCRVVDVKIVVFGPLAVFKSSG